MKQRISTLLLFISALVPVAAYVADYAKRETEKRERATLADRTKLLIPAVAGLLSRPAAIVDANVVKTLALAIGTDISVIDRTGAVVADSAFDPNAMANQKDMPEVVMALQSDQGIVQRTNEAGESIAVAASAVIADGEVVGVVRATVPLERIKAASRRTARFVWTIFALMGIGGLTTIVCWRRRRTGLQELASSAAIEGDPSERGPMDALGGDAIGELARAFDRMRRELSVNRAEVSRAQREIWTMLEMLPEGVVVLNGGGGIVFANPSFYRLLELPRAMVVTGRPIWEVVRVRGVIDAVQKVVENNETVSNEFRSFRPARSFALRARPFRVRADLGAILLLQDVTELRKLERLRQEFVANVSHELKTPLASIKAFAETLLADDVMDAATRRRFLVRIEEQADRLHALVLDMLMLARIEAGAEAFALQSCDVGAIVTQVLEAASPDAARKHVTLCWPGPAEPLFALADEEGLSTIVRNLLDNAIKYTPTGGSVTVSAGIRDDAAFVEIADTGVGIPKQDFERVFERFYRVEQSRSRDQGGTGLGLSIVKHLTQTFGGSVSVASRLNHGSTFTVRLPIAPTESDVAARRTA